MSYEGPVKSSTKVGENPYGFESGLEALRGYEAAAKQRESLPDYTEEVHVEPELTTDHSYEDEEIRPVIRGYNPDYTDVTPGDGQTIDVDGVLIPEVIKEIVGTEPKPYTPLDQSDLLRQRETADILDELEAALNPDSIGGAEASVTARMQSAQATAVSERSGSGFALEGVEDTTEVVAQPAQKEAAVFTAELDSSALELGEFELSVAGMMDFSDAVRARHRALYQEYIIGTGMTGQERMDFDRACDALVDAVHNTQRLLVADADFSTSQLQESVKNINKEIHNYAGLVYELVEGADDDIPEDVSIESEPSQSEQSSEQLTMLMEQMQAVQNYDELYEIVRAIGSFSDDRGDYSASQVILKIERFRGGSLTTQFIPEMYGLRMAVERIQRAPEFVEMVAAAESMKQLKDIIVHLGAVPAENGVVTPEEVVAALDDFVNGDYSENIPEAYGIRDKAEALVIEQAHSMSSENSEMTDLDVESLIMAVNSFDELYDVLRTVAVHDGDSEESLVGLISTIESIRRGETAVQLIEDGFGLPETIIRLLEQESQAAAEEIDAPLVLENPIPREEEVVKSVPVMSVNTPEDIEPLVLEEPSLAPESSPETEARFIQDVYQEITKMDASLAESRSKIGNANSLDLANYAVNERSAYKRKSAALAAMIDADLTYQGAKAVTHELADAVDAAMAELVELHDGIIAKEQGDFFGEVKKNWQEQEVYKEELAETVVQMREKLTQLVAESEISGAVEYIKFLADPKDRIECKDLVNKYNAELQQLQQFIESASQDGTPVTEIDQVFERQYNALAATVNAIYDLLEDRLPESGEAVSEPAVAPEPVTPSKAAQFEKKLPTPETKRFSNSDEYVEHLFRNIDKGRESKLWKGGIFISGVQDTNVKDFMSYAKANNRIRQIVTEAQKAAGPKAPNWKGMSVAEYVATCAEIAFITGRIPAK